MLCLIPKVNLNFYLIFQFNLHIYHFMYKMTNLKKMQ